MTGYQAGLAEQVIPDGAECDVRGDDGGEAEGDGWLLPQWSQDRLVASSAIGSSK